MRLRVCVALAGLIGSASAESGDRKRQVLLSARICVKRAQKKAAASNNRALKKAAPEDVEDLGEYDRAIQSLSEQMKTEKLRPIACTDKTVKLVAHCLPE